MSTRPVTTLFLLISADGKISTGSTDAMDFDRDLPLINGVKEGLYQYYDIEETTDAWSLNTGRVMQKIGVNERSDSPVKMPVSFVIIDNKPHLDAHGIQYLCRWVSRLVLVTDNEQHPAFSVKQDNLSILYNRTFEPEKLLHMLRENYGVERLTIQSGGTLNAAFLRAKLLDYVDIVVAPVLVGGKDTSSLIDGPSLTRVDELDKLGAMKLERCDVLEHSYVRLRYQLLG